MSILANLAFTPCMAIISITLSKDVYFAEQAWGSKKSFTLLAWGYDKWVISRHHSVDFGTTPIGEIPILEMGMC